MIKYETDSRNILPRQTFVAIKGHKVDGHKYIEEAIKKGAIEIIAENKVTCSVPVTIVNNTEEYLNNKLVEEYSTDLNELNIIGVTGTNGKTTTCFLTYQMLQKLNVNVAYIGTIGFHHKNESFELENTTPDILTLYKLLYKAKNLGCTHIVMEVSSHALAFKRIEGLQFICGAFTNLTQDHLDYHITMENYLNEKLKLIDYMKPNGNFIVNSDDPYGKYFVDKFSNSKTIGENGDYKIINYDITAAEINLTFSYNNSEYNVIPQLTSKFNIYNYLTSLAIINNIGFEIEKIIDITSSIVPPKGRCETIKVNDAFAVIDYAHTPDAVEKVITAYNELKKGKVITIIGCGGDRDPKKRPIMGNTASELSDYVIFTNDNPRTEDEFIIMDNIIAGVTKDNYEIIHDRHKAIIKGLELLNTNDILLILGKGHEDYQIIGTTKHHFDDAEEVKNWL